MYFNLFWANDGNWTHDLILTKDALYPWATSAFSEQKILFALQFHFNQLLYLQSGRRDSNSRPSAWKADALPAELLPLIITFYLYIKVVINSIQ